MRGKEVEADAAGRLRTRSDGLAAARPLSFCVPILPFPISPSSTSILRTVCLVTSNNAASLCPTLAPGSFAMKFYSQSFLYE